MAPARVARLFFNCAATPRGAGERHSPYREYGQAFRRTHDAKDPGSAPFAVQSRRTLRLSGSGSAAVAFSSRCATFDGAGNRQHHRLTLEQPGQRHLPRRRVLGLGQLVQRPAGPGQIAVAQRILGNKADAIGLAVIHHIIAVRGRPDCSCSAPWRRERPLPPALMSATETSDRPAWRDHAFVEQLFHRAELFGARHTGIDAVQLPQRDLLHAQLVAALCAPGDQMLGPAIDVPHVRAAAGEARPWWRSEAPCRDAAPRGSAARRRRDHRNRRCR